MRKTYHTPASHVLTLQADHGVMLALSGSEKRGNTALSNRQEFESTDWKHPIWGKDEE